MQLLLVQSCSKSKNTPTGAVPALDLYSGYFFKIIKKAMREGDFDDSIDICILSAKHGIISPDKNITWYDEKMDAARAKEMAPQVKRDLQERAATGYDDIIINAGSSYRQALEGLAGGVKSDVHYIEGDGIGSKGRVLKRFIRGESGVVTEDSNEMMEDQR